MKRIYNNSNNKKSNLNKLNFFNNIHDHLVNNKTHSMAHRMIVGLGIMVTGISIPILFHCETAVIKVCTDFAGYTIHAIGAIPFVEHLTKKYHGKS